MRSHRHRNVRLIRAGVVLIGAFVFFGARTAQADGAAGSVASASGGVQIQHGAAVVAATPGTPVNQGDKIISGAGGVAVITLSDGTRLELQPSTDVTLEQYTSGGATPTRVLLAAGILKSDVKKTPGTPANYQVHTANAIVTAHGTVFYTSYTNSSPQTGALPGVSHYTEVAVLEGSVKLAQDAAPDRGVEIAQGTTGTVAGGDPPDSNKRKFPTCSPAPVSVDQCKNGGWQNFTCDFKNQGQCISFVHHEH